jgi:hypothetical protein
MMASGLAQVATLKRRKARRFDLAELIFKRSFSVRDLGSVQ